MTPIFHLAIPSHDLDSSAAFYSKLCKLGRRGSNFLIVNFFGSQVVLHLVPSYEVDQAPPTMYPRHFGIVCKNKLEFINYWSWAKAAALPFFEEIFDRYKGKPEEHQTFFLKDPSKNLIEFKWYLHPQMVFLKDLGSDVEPTHA